MDQNPILVNQTESDKALRERCATVCEEIFSRLRLQVGDFSAEVAPEYASVVPVGWLFQERKSSVELRLCSVAQRRGRFGAKLPERKNTAFGMAFIGPASGSVEVGQ